MTEKRGLTNLDMTAEQFLQTCHAMLEAAGQDHLITIGFTDIDGVVKNICLSLEDYYEWEEIETN